jgi:hypothetical protein
MTDLDQLLARIDTTLTECDATQLPPMPTLAAAMRVPREIVEGNPTDMVAQLKAEHAVHVDRATSPPPTTAPVPAIEGQALVEASPTRLTRLVRRLLGGAPP